MKKKGPPRGVTYFDSSYLSVRLLCIYALLLTGLRISSLLVGGLTRFVPLDQCFGKYLVVLPAVPSIWRAELYGVRGGGRCFVYLLRGQT